jgi:hypothetical protein
MLFSDKFIVKIQVTSCKDYWRQQHAIFMAPVLVAPVCISAVKLKLIIKIMEVTTCKDYWRREYDIFMTPILVAPLHPINFSHFSVCIIFRHLCLAPTFYDMQNGGFFHN